VAFGTILNADLDACWEKISTHANFLGKVAQPFLKDFFCVTFPQFLPLLGKKVYFRKKDTKKLGKKIGCLHLNLEYAQI
jgi:hypothetical protein